MNLNPFIILIVQIINLYGFILVLHIIMSWLLYFDLLNARSPAVNKIMHFLHRLTEPTLGRIRKYMPKLGSVDISPVVLFLLLILLKNILITYFYV